MLCWLEPELGIQMKKIHFVDNLAYDYVIPYLKENSALYFLNTLKDGSVKRTFERSNAGETLEALMKNDLNISKTAECLYVHRNTVLYRLEKMKKETGGLDPKRAKDLFTLLLAYHIYLYYEV